jgi:pyruvate,water dikinase
MNATLLKYGRPDMERRLEIMGKLTPYTKQLDMAMYNDAVTGRFIEDFIKEHMRYL